METDKNEIIIEGEIKDKENEIKEQNDENIVEKNDEIAKNENIENNEIIKPKEEINEIEKKNNN